MFLGGLKGNIRVKKVNDLIKETWNDFFAIFKLDATCNCNMFRRTNHHNSTKSSKYVATATKML